MILLITMFPLGAYAQDDNTSRQIDEVLVQMEDGTVVTISIEEYVSMYMFKNGNLYNFLINSDGQLFIYGIASGEKYITIESYVMAYMLSDGDTSTALETAEAIPSEVVSTFKEVIIDEETGEINLVPINGEEEPTVVAIYSKSFLPNMVYVVADVEGLPDAAKFSIEYRIVDGDQSSLRETEKFNLGEETDTIFYNPSKGDPYNKVNIKIYNSADELIHTFNDVVLIEENS